jgi:hypothetical protein
MEHSLRRVNILNAEFWNHEREITSKRAADEGTCAWAMNLLKFEVLRGIPIEKQMTLDYALAQADSMGKVLFRNIASKGGRAPKKDALQILIDQIVEGNPDIQVPRLLYVLNGERGAGVVTEVPSREDWYAGKGEIHFVEEDGREKMSPFSGLKHRLSRAKKKFRAKRARATS